MIITGPHFQSGLSCMQAVRAHPLALQSAQLQHLIAEASAAQQGSQDATPPSQVHSLTPCSKPMAALQQSLLQLSALLVMSARVLCSLNEQLPLHVPHSSQHVCHKLN